MKIQNSEINILNVCISQILATTDRISGGIIFNLNRNAGILKPLLEDIDSTRKAIVDQYVDKDEDGKHKVKEDSDGKLLSFTKENEALANSEIEEVFKAELDVDFIKLPLSKFETLSLDTSKVPGLNVFIDFIIDEDN
jgi:hypothetical protein